MSIGKHGVFVCVGALIGASVAPACVNGARTYPEKRYFVLDVSREGPARSPAGDAVLRVRTFRVSPSRRRPTSQRDATFISGCSWIQHGSSSVDSIVRIFATEF